LNKEDLLVQELITGTMEEIIRSLHNDEKAAMDSLEKFFNRYSFIDRNGKYGEIHAYYLARIASQNFSKDKKKEGDVYLASIENIIAHQPEISKKVEQYFAAAFIENYYYYVRRKQYKEAKAFILQAAKYYSANEDIKAKLKWIDEVLQTK
jgi:hypothetical protein